MSVSEMFVGRQWVESCHFHDLGDREVLSQIADRVSHTRALGHVPIVLFDLDSTLYEVQSRTLQILREWCTTEAASEFPVLSKALMGMTLAQVGYSLKETLSGLRLGSEFDREQEHALSSLKPFWSARFFSSAYLRYDKVYPGAEAFAQAVYALGAFVVYLTGRDEPGMGQGTRERLVADGFPFESHRTHLILKARSSILDIEHKKAAAEWVSQHGVLVASFENEPVNLVMFSERFPESMHVFMDTVCSDHPAAGAQGLYRIRSFPLNL